MTRLLPTTIALVLAALLSVPVPPAHARVGERQPGAEVVAAAGADSDERRLAREWEQPGGPLVVPAVVHAGDLVVLSWQLPDGEIEELELELSVDGGPWRRISPELPGLTRRFEWRVSAGAAERARLRLCVGTERGEYELPPSAAFTIVDEPATPRPPDARPLGGSAPWPGALRDSRPSLRAQAQAEPIDAPTRVALLSPSVERIDAPRQPDEPRALRSAGASGRRPRFVPLRN